MLCQEFEARRMPKPVHVTALGLYFCCWKAIAHPSHTGSIASWLQRTQRLDRKAGWAAQGWQSVTGQRRPWWPGITLPRSFDRGMNSLHNCHFPWHSGCTKTARKAERSLRVVIVRYMGFLGIYLPREGVNLKSNFLKNFIKRLSERCSRRIKGKRNRLWPAVPAMCKEQNELCCPITCTERSTELRPLTPPTLCLPQGNHRSSSSWENVATEFPVNLEKCVKTWYGRQKWHGGEKKSVLCPDTLVQPCMALLTHSVFLCGSLGTWPCYAQKMNAPLEVLTNATL